MTAPTLILELAKKVNMTPIAWKEYPDRVVIVFQEGQKLTFDRLPEKPALPAPVRQPASRRSRPKA
jgi:hypothetical protein